MSAYGGVLAERSHRQGHHGQCLKAERAASRGRIAQRAGHQAAIAPARMWHAKAAHEVMGSMGFEDKPLCQIGPQGWRGSGKPSRPCQKIIQKAGAHRP